MTKIETIEKTIYNLENDVYPYGWINPNSCNCGVLAKTILGGKCIYDAGYSDAPVTCSVYGAFSRRALCMTTNLPLPELFQTLKDAGFTFKELSELEYLSNLEITTKAGIDLHYSIVGSLVNGTRMVADDFDHKPTLIRYLKAWLEILKEQEQPTQLSEQPVTAIRYVPVLIPESVNEQLKELILN